MSVLDLKRRVAEAEAFAEEVRQALTEPTGTHGQNRPHRMPYHWTKRMSLRSVG